MNFSFDRFRNLYSNVFIN